MPEKQEKSTRATENGRSFYLLANPVAYVLAPDRVIAIDLDPS